MPPAQAGDPSLQNRPFNRSRTVTAFSVIPCPRRSAAGRAVTGRRRPMDGRNGFLTRVGPALNEGGTSRRPAAPAAGQTPRGSSPPGSGDLPRPACRQDRPHRRRDGDPGTDRQVRNTVVLRDGVPRCRAPTPLRARRKPLRPSGQVPAHPRIGHTRPRKAKTVSNHGRFLNPGDQEAFSIGMTSLPL